MKQKYIKIGVVLLFNAVCHAENKSTLLPYIREKQSLNDFIMYVVPQGEQKQFRAFYVDYSKKNEKKSVQVKDTLRARLQENALYNIEVKHPHWAKEIKKYTQHKPKYVKIFLTRYGIYEEFNKKRSSRIGSLWTKITQTGKKVKNKIVSWVSSWRDDATPVVS